MLIETLTIYDIIGLVGSVIVVVVYYLATKGKLPAHETPFNVFNIAGGILVMISLIMRPNAGAIVIEVMFLFIALLAVWRNWRS